MLHLNSLINDFFAHVTSYNVDIYNEFSLQHELGLFLREKLPYYKIQFERNVSFFALKEKTIKKEIDISIFLDDMSEKHAIELKCPLNGQYPEQMYSFVKDIKFMEQLAQGGFDSTYCVSLVSDPLFYQGNIVAPIYRFFRHDNAVYGEVFKPTGERKHDESIILNGKYYFKWQSLDALRKYYIIDVKSPD